MKRSLKLSFILVPMAVLIGAGCEATRGGYDSAPYKTVREDGRYEVRDYPSLVLAQTETGNSGNDGFGRLFKFISGANADGTKIAMTTPVFMQGSGDSRTMAFVLPSDIKASSAPSPTDGEVAVRETEAGRFAAFRFSGGRSAAAEKNALGALRAWMTTEGLAAKGEPVFGYFDPPWTPAFLRRNEVMLRVAE